jgi:hypothetical protein
VLRESQVANESRDEDENQETEVSNTADYFNTAEFNKSMGIEEHQAQVAKSNSGRNTPNFPILEVSRTPTIDDMIQAQAAVVNCIKTESGEK